jgi:hypothetical protein
MIYADNFTRLRLIIRILLLNSYYYRVTILKMESGAVSKTSVFYIDNITRPIGQKELLNHTVQVSNLAHDI